ncbi:hypothetical protein NQZ79_g3818 [Umbelopsis isabellina]|nr:hypothetical protein NQZ79_g3818 [Umbelopsis isabellina]
MQAPKQTTCPDWLKALNRQIQPMKEGETIGKLHKHNTLKKIFCRKVHIYNSFLQVHSVMTTIEKLILYYQLFRFPESMFQHGLTLLQDVVDINASTPTRLCFKVNATIHTLEQPYECRNVVYLLAKGAKIAPATPDAGLNIEIEHGTKLYCGQTQDFKSRESGRRGSMSNSSIRLCLYHGCSHYQMDVDESIMIGFLFANSPHQVENKSPYPVNIYMDVPVSLDPREGAQHVNLVGRNSYRWLQRIAIIATAPPETSHEESVIAAEVSQTLPLVNWAPNPCPPMFRFLLELFVNSDTGLFPHLPLFVNHYPEFISQPHNTLSATLAEADIIARDSLVRKTIMHWRADILIMLGARPSLLSPLAVFQKEAFLVRLVAVLDFTPLTRDNYALMLWWPDPGSMRYLHYTAKSLLRQAYNLLSLLLRLLLCKLDQEYPDKCGFTIMEVRHLQLWYHNLPLTQQLQSILERLAPIFNNLKAPISMTESFELVLSTLSPSSHPPPVRTFLDSLISADEDVPGSRSRLSTINDIIARWSKSQATRFIAATQVREPNYLVMLEDEQVASLQRTVDYFVRQKQEEQVAKAIQDGWFIPRNLPVFWLKTHGKIKLKCPDNCLGSVSKSEGWGYIRGIFRGCFPEHNVVYLFLQSMTPNYAITARQLAAGFLTFCQYNQEHPQAEKIYSSCVDVADSIMGYYACDNKHKQQKSSFQQALENSINMLGTYVPHLKLSGDRFEVDKKVYGSKTRGLIYVFWPSDSANKFVVDLKYMNYNVHINTSGSVPLLVIPRAQVSAHKAQGSTSKRKREDSQSIYKIKIQLPNTQVSLAASFLSEHYCWHSIISLALNQVEAHSSPNYESCSMDLKVTLLAHKGLAQSFPKMSIIACRTEEKRHLSSHTTGIHPLVAMSNDQHTLQNSISSQQGLLKTVADLQARLAAIRTERNGTGIRKQPAQTKDRGATNDDRTDERTDGQKTGQTPATSALAALSMTSFRLKVLEENSMVARKGRILDQFDYQPKHHYVPRNAHKTARKRWESLRQAGSVTEYNKAVSKALIEVPNVHNEEAVIRYISGLKPATREYVELEEPEEIQEAMQLAETYDRVKFGRTNANQRLLKPWRQSREPQRNPTDLSMIDRNEALARRLCFRSGTQGHLSRYSPEIVNSRRLKNNEKSGGSNRSTQEVKRQMLNLLEKLDNTEQKGNHIYFEGTLNIDFVVPSTLISLLIPLVRMISCRLRVKRTSQSSTRDLRADNAASCSIVEPALASFARNPLKLRGATGSHR